MLARASKSESLETIHRLRQHNFGLFLAHPPSHYVSINTILNVSKTGHFLDPSTQSFFADVMYEWSHGDWKISREKETQRARGDMKCIFDPKVKMLSRLSLTLIFHQKLKRAREEDM